ncbi:MAG: prephenate dehydratase [archaeon]
MEETEKIRREIDTTDEEILRALSARVALAKKIGEHKKNAGMPIADIVREQGVLNEIGDKADKIGLPRERVEKIYREIIGLCRSVQTPEKRVAFLGPRGTFCEQAARDHFRNENAVFEERPSVADVFRSVKAHEVDSGVVPIENSNEGSVVGTLDLLSESSLMISGEIILSITHNLIVRPDMQLGDVHEVASHPQALAQCRRYLEENLPAAKQVETSSTAAAVKIAKEREKVAAIGHELAARLYAMKIIAYGIEDNHDNYTRFFVLNSQDQQPSGRDRTSILFSVKHEPGSLQEALQTLSSRMINLSKIESRPARSKRWEYVFFCDFEGHRRDAKCQEALKELQEKTINLKILGSYPRAQ